MTINPDGRWDRQQDEGVTPSGPGLRPFGAEPQDASQAKPLVPNARWVFDDGGRAAAGFKGSAGDCVARAVAIASGRPYAEVYQRLAEGAGTQRRSKLTRKKHERASARNGILTGRKWFKDYMAELGFQWVPTMGIGTGCKVHLRADELPSGRIIASVSNHVVAIIDGTIHDTHDPSRGGKRCVYGYWRTA